MKKVKMNLLLAAFAVTLLFVSCSKEESSTNTTTIPSYFLSCKISGVSTQFAKVQVSRATINNAETFTIKANKTTSGADTATVVIITLKKQVAGWTEGMNYWIDGVEEFGSFNYITTAGMVYNTKNLSGAKKMSVTLSKVSYKKDGVITGTFAGSTINANKQFIEISEGSFNCLVQN
jgi:hypothetical protein